MKSILLVTVWVGGVAAGCAESVPPPNDQWTAAQVAVGRAQAIAPTIPDAKLHLQLAEEDLQKSKQLMGNDNKRASSLVELATVEAQLATSIARANGAEDSERKAQDDLDKTINK
jgi:F0F1-type ATP synthase membrane subunit b/b'